MGVFTTQTLLSSVGVSKNKTTPGAVAINWILKVKKICISWQNKITASYVLIPLEPWSKLLKQQKPAKPSFHLLSFYLFGMTEKLFMYTIQNGDIAYIAYGIIHLKCKNMEAI